MLSHSIVVPLQIMPCQGTQPLSHTTLELLQQVKERQQQTVQSHQMLVWKGAQRSLQMKKLRSKVRLAQATQKTSSKARTAIQVFHTQSRILISTPHNSQMFYMLSGHLLNTLNDNNLKRNYITARPEPHKSKALVSLLKQANLTIPSGFCWEMQF